MDINGTAIKNLDRDDLNHAIVNIQTELKRRGHERGDFAAFSNLELVCLKHALMINALHKTEFTTNYGQTFKRLMNAINIEMIGRGIA